MTIRGSQQCNKLCISIYLGTYIIATKYSSNRSIGESGVTGEDMDLGGNVLGKLLGSWVSIFRSSGTSDDRTPQFWKKGSRNLYVHKVLRYRRYFIYV